MVSWLSPQGEFFPVQGSHEDTARNLVEKLNISPGGKSFAPIEDPFLNLLHRGWGRIQYVAKLLYFNNPYRAPNRQQLQELEYLAAENSMDEIIWDSDADEKILWSRHNSL